jgi:hypothetical protein
MTHALYALPHSLYSGRARSYLIKNNIPFQEFSCGHESYKAELYGEFGLWVRPHEMFIESVTVDGHSVPRFRLLRAV